MRQRAPFGLRYFAVKFSPTIALFVVEIVLCLLSRKLIETLLHFIAGTQPWLDEDGKAQIDLLERMLKQPVADFDAAVTDAIRGTH